MSTVVAEIAGRIQLLSSAEKNDLLRLLLLDIEGADDADADEAWRNEIVHRVKAIRNGEAAIRALQEEWQE
ncbi:MAG: addiction module protein [Telluria sp.]